MSSGQVIVNGLILGRMSATGGAGTATDWGRAGFKARPSRCRNLFRDDVQYPHSLCIEALRRSPCIHDRAPTLIDACTTAIAQAWRTRGSTSRTRRRSATGCGARQRTDAAAGASSSEGASAIAHRQSYCGGHAAPCQGALSPMEAPRDDRAAVMNKTPPTSHHGSHRKRCHRIAIQSTGSGTLRIPATMRPLTNKGIAP